MNIRFYNAQILPMNGNMDIIHGEVWVEGNTITYVGPHKECGNVWDREIDAEKNLIMPGFKNAHTHTAMTFLRSYADDMPLQDWLTKQIFPMEAKLQPDDIYWLSKLGIMEYLTSGITSCFDMYLNTEMMAKASVECGFRSVLVSGINDFSSSLEEVEADFNTYNQYDELIRYCLGFHAEYTCSEELLKKIAELSQRYKAPVFAHMSETEREVAECVQRHGTTPAAYLDSLGLFEHGGGGYHCIWFTDEEIELFRRKGLTAVTNPGSNTKLASGIANTTAFLKHGVNMAIGTDGPASNNCLDMFREMFLVTGLGKLHDRDASAVPAEEVLKMAVTGGAKAMGLTDCDCLAEGKKADFITINIMQPHLYPTGNLVNTLLECVTASDVCDMAVDGRLLMKDREVLTLDEEKILYEAMKYMEELEA